MNHKSGQSLKVESDLLRIFCREQSQNQLNYLAKIPGTTVGDFSARKDDRKQGQWVSVIFASSGAIRLTFKAYYIESEIQQLVGSAFGDSEPEKSRDRSSDFVREFCNVSAGAIKKTFEANGPMGRMSLPFVTRGSDQEFFGDLNSPFHFEDSWSLAWNNDTLCCAVSIEFLDKSALKKILLPAFGLASSNGEVEFL